MDSTDYENMDKEELLWAIHELKEDRDYYKERYEDICYCANKFVQGVIWEHDVDGR